MNKILTDNGRNRIGPAWLHAGGLAMQSIAQIPLTLTTVPQALIVLFVAAPALVSKIVPFLKPRQTRALRPVPEEGLA